MFPIHSYGIDSRVSSTVSKSEKRLFRCVSSSAIGAGAVQANMAVFGAEQVREQKTARQYFDNYYAAVNIGGLTAFGFIAYAQQNYSYVIGYTVPAGLLILALLLFFIGCKFYTTIEPEDSVLSKLFPVFRSAFRTWRKQRRYATTSPMNASGMSDPLLARMNEQVKSFLDYAKVSNQGDFLDRVVDDIKSLRRILAVFLLLIPYWLIYVQVKNRISSFNDELLIDLDRNNISYPRCTYENLAFVYCQ